jgi:anti-sigma B factor antagonist
MTASAVMIPILPDTSVRLYRIPIEMHRWATPTRPRGDLVYIVRRMNVSSDAPADINLRAVQHSPDARVVTVVGDIDTRAALALANFLAMQLAAARVVVVNLDGVSLLAPAGLSALFEASELATRQHRALRLVCNSSTANWALAAAGLRDYFTFADTVPGAVKHPACRHGGGDVALARRRYRSRRSGRRGSRPVAPAI